MAQSFGEIRLEGKIFISIGDVVDVTEVGTFEFPIELIQRTESDGLLHLGASLDQNKINHRLELVADGIRSALESE